MIFLISGILILICVILRTKQLTSLFRVLQLAYKIPNSNNQVSFKELLSLNNDLGFKLICSGTDSTLTKIWFGPFFGVIINSPDDAKIVLNSVECLGKPKIFLNFFDLPESLAFSKVALWQRHRKIMNPFFNTHSVRTFIPKFIEKSNELVQNVREMKDKGQFNIFGYMSKVTIETALNVVELDDDQLQQESKAIEAFINTTEGVKRLGQNRFIQLWNHVDKIYELTSAYREKCQLLVEGRQLLLAVVRNVKEKIRNETETESGDETKKNFIRELLNPKHNLKESEILDEANIYLAAGYETVSITMSWVLVYLGIHKNIQKKVVDELFRVVDSSEEILQMDFEKINQLEYLEMVINETLRLQPPLPIILRNAAEEVHTSEGYIIPKNGNIVVPIYKIHRNPHFWGDDAEKFIPERFSQENSSKFNPNAFLPFLKGPRNCIGSKYGMTFMKIQLAHFIMRYEIDSKINVDEAKYHYFITMKLIDGHMISIKERQL